MSEKQINITTTQDTLVIVEQKTFEKLAPKALHISGDIFNPAKYLAKRKDAIAEKQDNCHVKVDQVNGKVTFVVDEENPYNPHTITGELKTNPDFEIWQINKETKFTKDQMVNLIRPRRHFFVDKQRHAELLGAFMNFVGKIEKNFEDTDDQAGRKKKLVEYTSQFGGKNPDGQTIFNNKFSLEIAIFLGDKFQKEQFEVEICLDPSDLRLKFYFQSLDLFEKLIKAKEDALVEAVKDFEDFCPVFFI